MRVFASYREGIEEASRQRKMIAFLWLINFIFGFVIFFLLFKRLSRAISKSLLAESLVEKFDFTFFFEFMNNHAQAAGTIFSVAVLLIGFYFLVSLFLYGGILAVLIRSARAYDIHESERRFAPVFFQGAGKYFGRFFRLTIYSLILWIIFALLMFLVGLLIGVLTDEGTHEQLAFYLIVAAVAIGLFFVALIKMVMDYVRIKLVTEDSRQVFISLFKTAWFVLKNFRRTLGLYYLLVVTGIVLWGIFWALKYAIPSNSLLTIFLTFVLFQIFIASRGWLKIAFQAAQMRFYQDENR